VGWKQNRPAVATADLLQSRTARIAAVTDSVYPPPPAADDISLALRPRDAARALGISERTLWSLTKQQQIPHLRFGKAVRYPRHLLLRWLEQQAAGGEVRHG
jgi:excisionase family DNA binding protein